MSFTDADLIARVLSHKDHNAFCELVRRYQSPVRAFLVKMTWNDVQSADDLSQETFLKAWQKLHTYRGGARFSTWLFGIAFNEFRMSSRRRRKQAWEAADESMALPEQMASTRDSDLHLDLTEALKLLNSDERAAVILCCQKGLSHEEAAQVLGCPLGTVKTNIMRGKKKMRQRLLFAYENYEST